MILFENLFKPRQLRLTVRMFPTSLRKSLQTTSALLQPQNGVLTRLLFENLSKPRQLFFNLKTML
ncbi:hypothetical protein [Streptococcus pneumoniae]|uniref:hypothetical protein n=1 Tax=Streptococcus pneumoniae TaxID=1313 RepID=UPI0015DAAF4B|nr:hypothetical protein [Streptococcus pneumoniae]